MARFSGEVRADGRLYFYDRRRADQFIATLAGQVVTVDIDKIKRQRSDNQNRWYWGCIIPTLGDYLGYDKEELHSALKFRFLQTHADGPLPTVRSTASLSTKEFAEYCDNCVRLAAEMGVVIEDPR